MAIFNAKLATRGLSVVSFVNGVLQLHYDPLADYELANGATEISDLTGFATQAVNDQLDGNTPELFPGLVRIWI